jgi:quinol monooxygenase YgiN
MTAPLVLLLSLINMSTPPFSLLVTLQFTTDQAKAQFLQDIAPLVQYIHIHEPTTLLYEVLLSDKDPLQVLVLERYQDKAEAFEKIHRSSTEFLAFRPKLQQMQQDGLVTVSGHSYIDAEF